MIEKYVPREGYTDWWMSCYVRCDSPGCVGWLHLGDQRSYCERNADWFCRSQASMAGWTTNSAWDQAKQDFCPDCSQKRDTLAGKPTKLNSSLTEVKKAIATWPAWFREHAALEGLLFRDLPAAEPDPVRAYDFSDLESASG